MMQQINDARAGIHNTLIRGDLKDLWSASQTFFDGSEYANVRAVKIYNPNLSIYGTGTPEVFWKTITSSNTSDGLLPRLLLFDVDGKRPNRVVPKVDIHHVPERLVNACKALAIGRQEGNFKSTAIHDEGDKRVLAATVPMDEGAEAALKDFKAKLDAHECPDESVPLINRTAEHAIKLALIVAVATDLENPVINAAKMAWAIELAWHLTSRMVAETNERVADTARESNYKRIIAQIKKAGKDGMSDGVLADKNRGMPERDRKEIVRDLLASERIANRTTAGTGGRPRSRYHYVK